jgi:hypothetical protein
VAGMNGGHGQGNTYVALSSAGRAKEQNSAVFSHKAGGRQVQDESLGPYLVWYGEVDKTFGTQSYVWAKHMEQAGNCYFFYIKDTESHLSKIGFGNKVKQGNFRPASDLKVRECLNRA